MIARRLSLLLRGFPIPTGERYDVETSFTTFLIAIRHKMFIATRKTHIQAYRINQNSGLRDPQLAL